MDLSQLIKRKQYLTASLEFVRLDIQEFIKTPTETVCIDDLKNQYDFDLRELKRVEKDIEFLIIRQQTKNLIPKEIEILLTQPFI